MENEPTFEEKAKMFNQIMNKEWEKIQRTKAFDEFADAMSKKLVELGDAIYAMAQEADKAIKTLAQESERQRKVIEDLATKHNSLVDMHNDLVTKNKDLDCRVSSIARSNPNVG